MNTKFPGRANYIGPTEGMFGLLHHDQLCGPSYNVLECVAYVLKDQKLPHEIMVRLHNMIYLDDVLCPEGAQHKSLKEAHNAQLKTLNEAYNAQLKTLNKAYRARLKTLDDAILTYILSEIPDCAWNGHELAF